MERNLQPMGLIWPAQSNLPNLSGTPTSLPVPQCNCVAIRGQPLKEQAERSYVSSLSTKHHSKKSSAGAYRFKGSIPTQRVLGWERGRKAAFYSYLRSWCKDWERKSLFLLCRQGDLSSHPHPHARVEGAGNAVVCACMCACVC